MPSSTARSRDHEIVLLGATGFVGRLTAEYLARHAPPDLRWAIAGRSPDKLTTVRDALAAISPACADLPLLTADVTDAEAVRRLAESTRALATTVGPYVLYGGPVVAACAAAGTDYLDLTGEPEFVDSTYLRHHAAAERTGARLIHAAGFDSIPHDLGAYFTVQHLPADAPIRLAGYVRASARISGGTLASALTGFSRPRHNYVVARRRRAADPPPPGRRVRSAAGHPHRAPTGRAWAVPFPSLDPQVVVRSARALPRYGPDFTYSHFAAIPRMRTVAGGGVALAGVFVAAQLPPLRRALESRLQAGEGPDAEQRARSWFQVTFVGEAAGQRVVTRVSGGDPGYGETAKMLAESALCVVRDDLPDTAGQVTTAAAMGDALTGRLSAAGIEFEVLPPG